MGAGSSGRNESQTLSSHSAAGPFTEFLAAAPLRRKIRKKETGETRALEKAWEEDSVYQGPGSPVTGGKNH